MAEEFVHMMKENQRMINYTIQEKLILEILQQIRIVL